MEGNEGLHYQLLTPCDIVERGRTVLYVNIKLSMVFYSFN